MVGRERGPDRVRARAGFAPKGALDEVHCVRRSGANLRVAVQPQQQAVGITDDGQVLAVVGEGPEPATNQRRGTLQRMGLPPLPDFASRRERRRAGTGGVYACDLAAMPGVGDRPPHLIEATLAQVLVPPPPKLAGPAVTATPSRRARSRGWWAFRRSRPVTLMLPGNTCGFACRAARRRMRLHRQRIAAQIEMGCPDCGRRLSKHTPEPHLDLVVNDVALLLDRRASARQRGLGSRGARPAGAGNPPS